MPQQTLQTTIDQRQGRHPSTGLWITRLTTITTTVDADVPADLLADLHAIDVLIASQDPDVREAIHAAVSAAIESVDLYDARDVMRGTVRSLLGGVA